jgi:hypothetical protein
MALQRTFGQTDRLANQSFAQASGNCVTERLIIGTVTGGCPELFEPSLDVRLIDQVSQRGGQQQ